MVWPSTFSSRPNAALLMSSVGVEIFGDVPSAGQSEDDHDAMNEMLDDKVLF